MERPACDAESGVRSTPLPPELVRRLSFIRLLLARAAEESRLPVPYCYDKRQPAP
jgi:hypothetical protein